MLKLLSGIWSYVLAGVAFVGLIAFWALQLIASGRKAERAETAERVNKQVKEARDVENRVDGAGADELGRMRDRWTR